MGRHTGSRRLRALLPGGDAGDDGDDEHGAGQARLGVPGRLAVVAAVVVVLVGAGSLLLPRGMPWASEPACPQEPVDVLVEPELRAMVDEIVAPLRGQRLTPGLCLGVRVRAQEGLEAAAGSAVLPPDRAPQIWIPDALTWVERSSWPMQRSAALATSPVVVATSRAAADALGWTRTAPTWNEALRGRRPMSVPDIDAEADSLAALIALWQTLGKGPPADSAVVNVVLAADRGEVPQADAALALARSGSVNAPVLPMTEQQVAAANRETGRPTMAAVYPREGVPQLDYPVMEVSAAPASPSRAVAVQRVLDRLSSPESAQVVRAAGFRDGKGNPGTGDGVGTGPVRVLPPPAKAETDGMVLRIQNLARPSRLLLAVDGSTSMRARLDDGITRIQLAVAAARLGSQLLPDRAQVGVWAFADGAFAGRPYRQIAPVAALGSIEKTGETHRGYMLRVSQNFERFLRGDGTSLHTTVLEASRLLHTNYDPNAVNAVILMTDGRDDSPDGPTLDQVVAELRRANAGRQKVAIFTAGLGPDADYAALRTIAEASGGFTYRIDNAAQGQTALLDGLRRSRHIG